MRKYEVNIIALMFMSCYNRIILIKGVNEMTKINMDYFNKGASEIYVEGVLSGNVREGVVVEAVTQINEDPFNALKNKYLGVKRYAGFGDQECNCEYGMGPKHGNIAFKIGRVDRKSDKELSSYAIYALEIFIEFSLQLSKSGNELVNLFDLVREMSALKEKHDMLAEKIDVFEFDENNIHSLHSLLRG